MGNKKSEKGLIYRLILLAQSEFFVKSLMILSMLVILIIPFCTYKRALRVNQEMEYETREERVNENKMAIRKAMKEYLEELGKKIGE